VTQPLAMSPAAALARVPFARLLRSPRGWISVGAWSALAVAFALAAREEGTPHGADHVLVDAYGALVLPLACYAVVGAGIGARSLSSAVAPLVAFGASAARAALMAVAVVTAGCAVTGAALGAIVALLAHGVADPPLAHDAITSAYAGALGGCAYGSLFSFGASLGKRGGGRTVLLVADWVLGSVGGAAGLVTPRAHLRNLLGGSPPVQLPERASAVLLVVLAVVYGLIAVRRARGRGVA
jgi:hypothetical protein